MTFWPITVNILQWLWQSRNVK